ncbi:hypothetical protein FNF28_00071 [Cafeteria roenbergensis]|uniref:JmjC domain-containing protein n=1 Tax=Cafeteria roenbergensis TaxID=33653 RepID=A0A5A8E4V2_CAFRO|nr:hypothetical protein FNF28_00071 [Cafeteria roenbergensis]
MHAAWLWAAGLEAHALRVGDVGLMLGGPDAVPGFPEAMDALHALVLSAGPGAASCDSACRKRPRCRSLQPAERGPKRVAAAAEFAAAPAAAVLSGAAAPPPEPADSARSPVWLTGDEYLGAKALRDALGAGAAEVDAIDAGDVAAGFERGWYRPGLPVVIGRGLLEHWPARGACGAARSWRNGRRLWQCLAERSVPVEVGSSYMADDWGQGLMRGGAFLEEAFESHQLLDQIPSLRADVSVPELCSLSRQDDAPREPPQAGGTSDARGDCASGSNTEPGVPAADSEARTAGACQAAAPRINVWIGPAGTQGATLLSAVVGPGEVLFIPKGWWHHVRSLTPSISLSFWWS